MKVTIVGGGVAGASTAIKLAESIDPKDIRLIDKNSSFNKACSGILTYAVDDLIKIPKEVIVSKVTKFRIHSPDKTYLEVNFRRPDIICEREKLNEHLNNLAHDKGVQVLRGYAFDGLTNESVKVKSSNDERDFPTTHLIGADGSQSSVAKTTRIFGNRKFFVGAKAIVEKEHDGAIDVYPNIGCFAWVVPHGEKTVEVGTMSYPHQGAVFDKFLKNFEGKVLSKEGAMIPVHDPFVKTQTNHGNMKVYLVGDAATMVKATTGGSIIQSFIAANALKDSIVNNTNYGLAWRKKLGLELWTHLRVRKVLDKFSEKDWLKLIHLFQDDKIKNILETKTRDYPTTLVLKVLMSKPQLLGFGKNLLKRQEYVRSGA